MVEVLGVAPDMIANNIVPSNPTHPGAVIKDELEFIGLSQRSFAENVGVAFPVMNNILNGRRALTPYYAVVIAESLNLDANSLLAMQARYDIAKLRRRKSLLKKLECIKRIAAVF